MRVCMSSIVKKHEEVEQLTAETPFDDNNEGFVFDTGVFDSKALFALDSIYKSLESMDQKSVSVKFMITIQDETDLKALGYSNDQIYKLNPQEAEDIIQAGTKAEPLNKEE